MKRNEQKIAITTFRRALSQERHNLLERPEIIWQQMYNRLQWADGEEKTVPVTQVIAPEFEKKTALGARPWLHNKFRTSESEALIMVLTGHNDEVKSCAFSPDGKILASANGDKTIKLWDMAMGKLIYTYPCIGDVYTCNFSPSGKMIAANDSRNLYVLELFGF